MDVDDQAIARFMETTHASADQAQFFLEVRRVKSRRCVYVQRYLRCGAAAAALCSSRAPVAPGRAVQSLSGCFALLHAGLRR